MATKQTYRIGDYWLTRNRSGKWCRTWYDATAQQRRTESFGTSDFQHAKKLLEVWFVNNVKPVLDDDLELSRCLLEYWNQHAKHLKRADTERRNARYWVDFFPDKLVRELRSQQQIAFLEHLRDRGFAKGTIESVFKTGTAAINYAWRNDMLLNPVPFVKPSDHLKKYRMKKTKRWRHLEINEVAALFDNATSDRLIRYLIVLIGCACRPSAAAELMGSQINRKEGLIDLLFDGEEQTNKYRPTVRLPRFIDAIYHPENIVTQSSVVANANNLRYRAWLPTRDAAGLDELVVPSSIRHTMAKWLRSQGIEAWATSSQLGHKAKGHEITEIYAPNDPAYLANTLEAIEDYFAKVYRKSKALKKFEGLSDYKPYKRK